MIEKKHANGRSSALTALGTLFAAAAMILYFYNRTAEQTAQKSSAAVLVALWEELQKPEMIPTEVTDCAGEEPYLSVYNAMYAGILEIPELDVSLPIYAECTEENLKNAPCRYSGSALHRNLVIAGHNYVTHFGELMTLSLGDLIYFTDAYGQVHIYETMLVEILDAYAVDEMASAEYPLTLFTCTYGGQNRVTVRCIET